MRFSDILGHESIKQRLVNLVDSDRVPHALLIHGRPGIGKLSMARALARYIHCSNRHDGDSCGVCPSCIQHNSFNHIDTYFSFPVQKISGRAATVSDDWIDSWRNFLDENPYAAFSQWLTFMDNVNTQPKIYVEESAALMRKLNFTSHSGRQIVIMWLPERMGDDCANKMLKLIEEPLGDTMFIMVSNNPELILPTIYSRTQRIEMLRLSDDAVTGYIKEHYSLDDRDAAAMAHLAEGSILQADYVVQNMDSQKQYLELFIRLMRLAYQKNVAELRVWSKEVSSLGREGAIGFITYCLAQVRENFMFRLQLPKLNYLTVDEREFATKFHRFINERNIISITQRLEQVVTDIRANGNANIILFDFAVRVIMLLRV